MIEYLKKEVQECVILCSSIKMWITLKIPKMEDGNDFGVAIQEECVDTISEIEESAYTILDTISTYHSTRGNYIVQVGFWCFSIYNPILHSNALTYSFPQTRQ